MTVDPAHWTDRLSALAQQYAVPGASLAFWHADRVHTAVTGVLNTATGAPVQPDSLFQIGSITKVWTATQIMLLVEQGELALDDRLVDVLPGFRVRDAEATTAITMRHLLTHTSGIDGDLFLDTGRGDDCLASYVAACAGLEQVFPVGASHSYCNSGFVIAGRVVEHLTGLTWDAALRDRICRPLGLTHTRTLPEDVLSFGAAIGHTEDGVPVDRWGLPRSVGPAGLVCARPADVVAFGRAHLTPGALLADPAALRVPQAELPNPYDDARWWGIGWSLDEWDGHLVAAHTGDTIGQHAALWVLPEPGTVATVAVNGGRSAEFQRAVIGELMAALHGIRVPAPPAPPGEPVDVDPGPFTGVYERAGSRITVTAHEAGLRLRAEPTGMLAGLARPRTLDLVPFTTTAFLAREHEDDQWQPVVFEARPDGVSYLHHSGRATPRVR
ncbi:serine hydrolase domain-containing protein [Streptantibioticus parmotrematis]|uniref:serine hydrolase domain-containing protein n=1 Tax=Streptantibioticus parmotrematis TaxID=2873249 RepID=UPI0033FCA165